MSVYPAPKQGFDLGVFNPAYFADENGALTLADAERLYYHKTGGTISGSANILGSLNVDGSLTIGGSLVDLSVITGVVHGVISADKAVITDVNKDALGFRNLSATGSISAGSLTGTLTTAAQPNITSLGTLTSLNVSGGSVFNGMLSSTANVIQTSSSLVITGGAEPTNTNGGGFKFNPMTSEFGMHSGNHVFNTDNNVNIQGSMIYLKRVSPYSLGSGYIGLFTNNAQSRFDFNQGSSSSTPNRMRLSYTVGSSYVEQYCDSSSYLNISNTPIVSDNTTRVATTGFVQNEFLDRAASTFSPSGFQNQTDSVINYDANTRILTISPVSSSFTVWVKGTKRVYSTTQTATAHTNAVGTYIFYFDDNGVLQWSTSTPSYTNPFVADVYYYDATHTLVLDERHGAEMDAKTHIELHNTQGTWYRNGLALSGYTVQPVGPVNGDNTFASATGQIADEDLVSTIGAVTDGGPYTVMYLVNASSQLTFSFGNSVPYLFGTYIRYNLFTGGTWTMTDAGNGDYVNYYVVYLPSIQPTLQMVLIPSQQVYSSLANAIAENFTNLSLGALSNQVPEYLVRYRITFRCSASYTTSGKCRIEQLDMIVGSRAIIQNSVATNHQALSGLQIAGSGSTYGHVNDTTQTIAGDKTFSGNTTTSKLMVGTSTDTSRMVSILDSTMANSDSRYLTLGKLNSTRNQAEISYFHSSDGSTSNQLRLGRHGGSTVYVQFDNKVGIANATPNYSLDINYDQTGIRTPGLYFATGASTQDSFPHSYYTNITTGGAAANKAMVLNGTLDYSGVNSFGAATINGSTSVSGSLGNFGSLQINSVATIDTNRNGSLLTLGLTGATKSLAGINTNGVLWNTSANRVAYFRDVSADNWALGWMAGGTNRDSLLFNHNAGVPLMTFDGSVIAKTRLWVGDTYTDTSRAVCCLDSTQATTTSRYITVGQANSANNSAEFSFYYAGAGSTSNQTRIGINGQAHIYCSGTGSVGIGDATASSTNKLTVSGITNSSGGYRSNGIDCINSSGTFISSGGVNCSGDVASSGRIRCTNAAGIHTFNGDSSVEVRMFSDSNNGYVGTWSDRAFRIIQGGATRMYFGESASNGGNICLFGTSTSFPLTILKGDGLYNSSSYKYYNSSGGNGSGSDTGNTVSLYTSSRIVCVGEIDIASDERIKHDIRDIDMELADKFVNLARPRRFQYKTENEDSFGYVAQELCKQGFDEFVQIHSDADAGLEKTIDADGFVSPANMQFSVNTGYFIPLLHLKCKQLSAENDVLTHKVKTLEDRLDLLTRRFEEMLDDDIRNVRHAKLRFDDEDDFYDRDMEFTL